MFCCDVLFFFFFSSRRRHTRSLCDWSSDVCSSDLRDAGVFHFRKTIDLADHSKKFVVYVSADNRFILFVNGTRIGEGPASSDLGHWKYETFDLRPFLHNGKNVIGATVWNFGTQAPVAQLTSRAGFILQGDDEAEQIANTDDSWEVEIESGHRPS